MFRSTTAMIVHGAGPRPTHTAQQKSYYSGAVKDGAVTACMTRTLLTVYEYSPLPSTMPNYHLTQNVCKQTPMLPFSRISLCVLLRLIICRRMDCIRSTWAYSLAPFSAEWPRLCPPLCWDCASCWPKQHRFHYLLLLPLFCSPAIVLPLFPFSSLGVESPFSAAEGDVT